MILQPYKFVFKKDTGRLLNLNRKIILTRIQNDIDTFIESFTFELNDQQTRDQVEVGVQSYLDSPIIRGIVTSSKVTVHTSSNTDGIKVNVLDRKSVV